MHAGLREVGFACACASLYVFAFAFACACLSVCDNVFAGFVCVRVCVLVFVFVV